MAQAPTASFITQDQRSRCAEAILLGYDDADLATILTSIQNNGYPVVGKGTTFLVNASVPTRIIGGINT